MTLKKSITALFTLSLSASAIAETLTASGKSFFDTLSEKEVTFSAGIQTNTLESGNIDLDFDGAYFSASFKPTKEFKVSTSYFTTETDTLAEYSLQELWLGLPTGDDEALLGAFGLDFYANGWGAIYDDTGVVIANFNNGYVVSSTLEMNEFEVGVSYVANFSSVLNYDFYLGYVSGELVTNEKLSNKLVYSADLSEVPTSLLNYINTNDFNGEGISNNEEYKVQNYINSYGYSYTIYPNDNLNARDVSTSVDYSTLVLKMEADFAVTNSFHLQAGLSSESTTMDNVDEDLHDTVYNVGASYTVWSGIGVEFKHKIYDGQTKTSVGINYAF